VANVSAFSSPAENIRTSCWRTPNDPNATGCRDNRRVGCPRFGFERTFADTRRTACRAAKESKASIWRSLAGPQLCQGAVRYLDEWRNSSKPRWNRAIASRRDRSRSKTGPFVRVPKMADLTAFRAIPAKPQKPGDAPLSDGPIFPVEPVHVRRPETRAAQNP